MKNDRFKKVIEILKYIFLIILFILTNKSNSIFGIISILYILFLVISGKDKENIKLLLFLLPNLRILDITGFKNYINICYLIIGIKIIIKNYKNIEGKNILKAIILAMTIVLMEIIHGISIENNITESIFNGVNIGIDFFILIVIINLQINLKEYSEYSDYLLLGVISSFGIFCLSNGNIINLLFSTGYRLSAYGNDPNYLSCYLLVGISGKLLYSHYQKLNIKDIILTIFNTFIGLLTSSKMCLISLIILYALNIFIFLSKLKIKKIIRIIIFTILLITILITFYGKETNYLINRFVDRFNETHSFSNTEIGNFTSGRSDLIMQYFNILSNDITSLLLGHGIRYINYYLKMGVTLVAHNTYLDIILSWGIIGTTILVIGFISCTKNILKIKQKFDILIPLIIYMIMLNALSCLSSDMFWYLLAFVLLPLSKKFVIYEEEKNEYINNSSNILS